MGWSLMVRRGLWLRLAGLLVGVEEEPLGLPFLRREGSDSLDVNLGRGMLADTYVVARRRALRLFTHDAELAGWAAQPRNA